MDPPKSQIRALLLYEFQLGHGPTEATRNVCQALGESAVSLRTTKNWFSKFRQGDESLEDQPRSGRPQEIDREALLEHVEANPTKSTRMLAADFDCGHVQIAEILHELGKSWRCSKWLPHDLTPAQRQRRVTIATELLLQQQIGVASCTTSCFQMPQSLTRHSTVSSLTECSNNYGVGQLVGGAEQHRHFFMTTLGHTLRGLLSKNWGSWAGSFANQDEVEQHLEEFFQGKQQDFYSRGIDQLVEKWQKMVDNDGAYFD
uniref:Mos1 transposase HTH domain-containing protein n=1 Tax=Globodera rostochiensis TaxID=31243 RepID=A0A914H940_GLORO